MKQFYSGLSDTAKSPGLRPRIIVVLLTVSLLPLVVVFGGASIVFSRLLMSQAMSHMRHTVASHSAAVDLFLNERKRALEIAAYSQTRATLATPEGIQRLIDILNATYPDAFVDLGVIDSSGRHLAYVGPYDLQDKNYRQAEWFKATLTEGSTISDVFLGFRGVPHTVIAVTRREAEQVWILRATINNDTLFDMVRRIEVGETGDAFIVNSEGKYQTPPKKGKVLGDSGLANATPHIGVADARLISKGVDTVQVTAWLNARRWMMVVRRPEAEIMAPARQAILTGTLVALIGVLLIVTTTWFATTQLTNIIDRVVAERDAISRDLMRSAKLASLGELAAGLAHEINNPLAVMSAEHTNISDRLAYLGREEIPVETAGKIAASVERCVRQIERCRKITVKMLQFGRQTEPKLALMEVKPLIEESIALMRKQVHTEEIRFHLEVEPRLPLLHIDGNEMEQVLVNLIGNAIQAIPDSGDIFVSARRAGEEVRICVEDTGCGIPEEALEHIFQPFYTTKPVGVGTGLGLSVCHGIIRSFKGTIDASSAVGEGTIVTVHLPIPPLGQTEEEV